MRDVYGFIISISAGHVIECTRKERSYNFYLIIAHVPFTIDHLLEFHTDDYYGIREEGNCHNS